MTPDIALAASAREWPDRLHRHLLDHGGGRVVARVLGPEQAVTAAFQVLFIDDVCSFLTPRLVAKLRERGIEVIGVFDPADGPDAKRRLLECGISDVVEGDAAADEMLHIAKAAIGHMTHAPDPPAPSGRLGWTIGVTGATAGVGATEVAIALATAAAEHSEVALVDLDPSWPSVAPRLDLPLHPNVRTAVDFVLHQPDHLPRAVQHLGRLAVVGGVADRGAAAPIGHVEADMLLESLSAIFELVVVDLGPLDRTLRALLPRFDTLAIVGTGEPVGVTRMAQTVETALRLVAEAVVVLVVNKVPSRSYHDAEIRAELSSTWPDLPVLTLPPDASLVQAVWNGVTPTHGPFAKATRRAASLITESIAG